MGLKDIIAIIISGMAFVLSLFAFFHTKKRAYAEALLEYLKEGDSEEMKNRRRFIYNHDKILVKKDCQDKIIGICKNNIDEKGASEEEKTLIALEKAITDLVSFFDKWAALRRHKFIPKWAISGPRATVFLHFCELTMFYIIARQKDDEFYAMDLMYMYNYKKIGRLKTKQKKCKNILSDAKQ